MLACLAAADYSAGFAAGFLGAGLFGLLFGYGLFGGMAGFGSIFGLLLQVLLIFIVARLIFAWSQRRNLAAAHSYAGARPATGYGFRPTRRRTPYNRQVGLRCVRTAAGKHPSCLLRRRPFSSARYGHSRLSYFSAEFGGHASRGLINRVTDVRLLQGDLAEAWREGRSDYATVAMKFALRDSIVERASGRLVEGGELSEVTELFVRVRGGNWPLSAIQQT